MDEALSRKLRVVSFGAIVLVLYVHAYNLTDRFLEPSTRVRESLGFGSAVQLLVSNGVARIAVPLFFGISGYLFFVNLRPTWPGFRRKIASRLFTLGIPFFVWSSLSLLWAGAGLVPVRESSVLGVLVRSPVAFQLWFLRDLLAYALLSPLIFLLLERLRLVIPALLFGLWAVNMPLPYLETEGLLFFLSGAALSRGGLAAFRAGWWRRPRLLGVSWLVVLAVKTGLAFSPATPPALLVGLQKASILLGVGAVWTLYDAEFVRRRIEPRLLRWTGFTFFIFAFHEPLQNVLMDALLARIGSGPGPSLFLYLAVPAFVIVAATGTAILLARHVRPVYLVLTGGREAPARGPDRDRVTGASPR